MKISFHKSRLSLTYSLYSRSAPNSEAVILAKTAPNLASSTPEILCRSSPLYQIVSSTTESKKEAYSLRFLPILAVTRVPAFLLLPRVFLILLAIFFSI